jgi:transcriptional regulator with XRE-family HTH domain
MPTFNHRVLRAWRSESGLRAEQVCIDAPISISYLYTLENSGGNPSAATLARLAAVYGRSLDELFTADSDTAGAR